MMRKTLHLFFAVLLLIVAGSQLSVASSGVAVTLLDYRLGTTQNVNLGYTLTVSAEVRNDDTVSFSGILDFGLRNTDSNLSPLYLFNKPPYSGDSVTLNPGEVVPAVFSIEIDDPYFAPGPDVVVVWPISSSPIADSIVIYLNIENPNHVEKATKDDFSYIVEQDRILLQPFNNEMNFQQVRILNILGQQAAYYSSNFITQIPVPDLPKGIYLCEMITADKKVRVIKFYH